MKEILKFCYTDKSDVYFVEADVEVNSVDNTLYICYAEISDTSGVLCDVEIPEDVYLKEFNRNRDVKAEVCKETFSPTFGMHVFYKV